MKKIFCLALYLLIALIQTTCLHAQSTESPRMFAVLETSVKPAWISVFESAQLDLYTLAKEKNISWQAGPIISLNEDCSYLQVFPPIKELNDLEILQNQFRPTKIEARDKLLTKILQARRCAKWIVLRERPDLSYHPGDHEITLGEASQYFNLTFFYGISGRIDEFEAVCKEWIELYKTNEIPYGYSVFETVLGLEQPSLLFVYAADDAGQFFGNQQKIAQKLGYSEAGMMEKAMKLCRRYEVRSGFYRPELTEWRVWGK
ncbi:MAG: hypothetical protein JXR73_15860 [Candidatus Omnitrophica bacterium]|nr:hypothetical protein [Candidatus Omnitrophota bacterium]